MHRRIRLIVVGLSLVLIRQGYLNARERMPEEEVKAAILFNTFLFVQWPPPDAKRGAQLSICTPTDNATFRALKTQFDGALVHNLKLSVQIPSGEMDKLRICDAVYVDGDNPTMLYQVSVATRDHPTLIVGEGARALESGAMIGLSLSGDRYVFDINLLSVRRAGLLVSSKLMRLARRVVE